MKLKSIITIAFAIICFASFSQSAKGTLYKQNRWEDVKGKGSWDKAMDNPTYEKAEVLKTSKNIKVTLGTKVYNYVIISEKKFSDMLMIYSTTLNGKNFDIGICKNFDGTISIDIDDIWCVPDITNISTTEIK